MALVREDASDEEVSEKGFFLSREPVNTMIEAVCIMIENGIDVHILSSVLDNPYVKEEKGMVKNLDALGAGA